jgi:dipeptidase E
LGLAKTVVLPHYNKVKNGRLDGKLFVQEIAAGHSWGRRFYAIPDGSYVLARNGQETIFGEAYLVADGKVRKFCEDGDHKQIR